MEHLIPLEIWAVLVAAPCMIAWFLGDLHGAARMRRMIEANDPIDPTDVVGTSTKTIRIPVALGSPSASLSPDGEKADSRPPKQKDTFTDMPSLADLHAQAQRIRETDRVWEDDKAGVDPSSTDPISARILQHYRGSINELGRHNALAEEPDFQQIGASDLKAADSQN